MMQHVDATRTLLLSQGYEPIKIISWQRAMTLVTLDKVEVVEQYDAEIRAVSIIVKVPAVIRLLYALYGRRSYAKKLDLLSAGTVRAGSYAPDAGGSAS